MSQPIRVLILEDNLSDAELMVFELRRSGFPPTWNRVVSEEEFIAALDSGNGTADGVLPSKDEERSSFLEGRGTIGSEGQAAGWDIILADYSLPQFDGMRALRLVRERNLDIPFIVVTGALGDERAAECVKQGATDFLLKDRLARLGPAVAHALEEKRLHREKRERDARLAFQAQVLSCVQDAVMAADNMQGLMAWNPGAELVYGWRADEVMGRNTEELLGTEYTGLPRSDVIQRLLRDGRVQTEVRQRCKDGRQIDVETHLMALKDPAGEVLGFVAANRDITERKRVEKELAAVSARLEELVKEQTRDLEEAREKLLTAERLGAVGRIAGSIAEQLREPLGIVRDAIYMMKLQFAGTGRHPGLPQTAAAQLAQAEGAIERCGHFISSLLDYAHARAPEPTRCSLVYLLTEAFDDADLPLTVKRKLQIPDGMPSLLVDRAQIMRVFANVIRNAHEAMPQGGLISTTAALTGEGVVVRISDTGHGIAREGIARLFEPLFTTKPQGAGLGLAIARNFVVANHGTMRIESEPGKGTTATITLPAG